MFCVCDALSFQATYVSTIILFHDLTTAADSFIFHKQDHFCISFVSTFFFYMFFLYAPTFGDPMACSIRSKAAFTFSQSALPPASTVEIAPLKTSKDCPVCHFSSTRSKISFISVTARFSSVSPTCFPRKIWCTVLRHVLTSARARSSLGLEVCASSLLLGRFVMHLLAPSTSGDQLMGAMYLGAGPKDEAPGGGLRPVAPGRKAGGAPGALMPKVGGVGAQPSALSMVTTC